MIVTMASGTNAEMIIKPLVDAISTECGSFADSVVCATMSAVEASGRVLVGFGGAPESLLNCCNEQEGAYG